jgi:hypothetical protein
MKNISILVVAVAAVAAALAVASPAGAEQPFDRCPADFDAWASVPGPVVCSYSWSEDRSYPAGTRCSFGVVVHIDFSATIYHYDQPERTVAHMVETGEALAANGKTLVRVARYTEWATAPIVFTDHGLKGQYKLPDGGVVTGTAGYIKDSVYPPEPEIFHGRSFDVDAWCAALT